ncbi:pyridoxamine 5'-phosphate oxidase family protein [Cucumibacter marinus]|uniref:pyridoxamine 5'-phosphate oxidase family protein n=1 Tax=Cucumibacter marinus TaxID=1121252 RepID=UPI0004020AF5|nr:pyridoxamine 5'-phosphate oxidase family protein [Cucumibacter marinus]
MTDTATPHRITTIEALEAVYGTPNANSTDKEADCLIPSYRRYVEVSPFVALATVGPEGIDCSPRGDRPGFVRVHNERTLMMPDRRGNNRVDSLRNIVRDPRCAFLFLIPGAGNCLRVNGRAHLSTDPSRCDSFAIDGKPPRSVIVLEVETVYFQCARAIIRAGLWDPAARVNDADLPSAGDMLAEITKGRLGGEAYDREWPGRAAKSLW